ncbi:MAG: LysM peptidoglycan-binding domain-containing protein [Anaerolineaceae bacterium]|nr:LysM peptidoglycan-binding domain-containing protein [Anaerolineaceae bacterium]
MAKKESPQNVINSYKKRQKMTPYLIGIAAAILIVGGIIVVIMWLNGPDRPGISMGETETQTPTNTQTMSPVPPSETPTLIPTDTLVPTLTQTSTPSGPFEYTVQDLDTCYDIALTFEVELEVLLAINNFEGCPIQPGQKILIPAPGLELPTETPIPADLPYGTELEYSIKSGDTLDSIASKFNSTIEQIMEDNEIEEINTIFVGQILTIKANIITPTPTLGATSTPGNQAGTPSATETSDNNGGQPDGSTPTITSTTALRIGTPTPGD